MKATALDVVNLVLTYDTHAFIHMLIKCSCFEIPASDKMFLILKLLNICTHVLLFHVLFFSTE